MDLAASTRTIFALISTLLLASCGQIESKLFPEQKPEPCQTSSAPASDSLTGSYIVAFRTEPGQQSSFSTFQAEARSQYRYLDETFLPETEVASIQFISTVDLSSRYQGQRPTNLAPNFLVNPFDMASEQPSSLARVDFTSETDAQSALARWAEQGKIWYAEPNYLSHVSQDATTNLFSDYKQKYDNLNYWWLNTINVSQAYESLANRDQTSGVYRTDENILNAKPIVAVLDSGVDYEHPALKSRIWTNTDVNASSCDNDVHGCDTTAASKGKLGNGKVYPYDTNGPNESCFGKSPNCSHGTHVAGIIAADYDWSHPEYNQRVAGVCPVCQIMIIKIVGKVGKDSGILDSSILSAFKYVSLFRREGSPAVRVINASFGKFVRSRSVGLLVRQLKERHGAIVIGAAGNEDSMSMEYPAAFKDAIAVAAVDQKLQKVDFSNFGRWVDIAAPGDAILSTVPGQAIDVKSGTSMAAPIVSGVAGLLLAQKSDVSFDDLRGSLINAADPSFYSATDESRLNHDCYYVKVKGEDIKQPLLGHGLLNARDSINRTAAAGQPTFSALDRVKPGCGVNGLTTKSSFWGLFFFAAPVFFALRRKRSKLAG